MTFKFVYDMPYVKNIIHFVLIPIFLIMFIGLIATLIYSKKCKDHDSYQYQFIMSIDVIVFSMLVIGFFLAVLLGYALALRNYMELYDFTSTICYFVLVSPILPAAFLIYLVVKLIKTVNSYEKEKEDDEKNKVLNNVSSIDEVVVPEVAVNYEESTEAKTEAQTVPQTEVITEVKTEPLTDDKTETESLEDTSSKDDDIELL